VDETGITRDDPRDAAPSGTPAPPPRERASGPAIAAAATDAAAPRRIATVDVGSNSIRLLIAELDPTGDYRLIDDEKVVTRLSAGSGSSRRLDPDAVERSIEAIRHMRTIAEGHEVERIRAVATCAVREAEDRERFLDRVRDEAGVELEVISGEEEARLALLSVRHAFDIDSGEVATVDIGGGSTEIVLTTDGIVSHVLSLSVGAVRLSEAVPPTPRTPLRRVSRMRKTVRELVRARLGKDLPSARLMIGTGGTFTTLAEMDLARRDPAPDPEATVLVRGHELHRADVQRMLESLASMTSRERLAVPGLSPDRVEIIVAGLAIAEAVMRDLAINRLVVHDRGVRDGVLLDMARELFPRVPAKTPRPSDRTRHARRFARACNRDIAHSENVTRLALRIYDQLFQHYRDHGDGSFVSMANLERRQLLETAAILHDVGYYISYSRHHKHSYYLIVHSDLPGWSHHELELIGLIARYHRRAAPSPRHSRFARLPAADRELVRELAAILRVAVGLDRAHTGRVLDVRLAVTDGRAVFEVESETAPDVELAGAAQKRKLFERTFMLGTDFRWAGRADTEDRHPGDEQGDEQEHDA